MDYLLNAYAFIVRNLSLFLSSLSHPNSACGELIQGKESGTESEIYIESYEDSGFDRVIPIFMPTNTTSSRLTHAFASTLTFGARLVLGTSRKKTCMIHESCQHRLEIDTSSTRADHQCTGI